MTINTDTIFIYETIQEELNARWKEMMARAQVLSFSDVTVVRTSDVYQTLQHDFAQSIVNKLKEFHKI